jgi:hypothetical protein
MPGEYGPRGVGPGTAWRDTFGLLSFGGVLVGVARYMVAVTSKKLRRGDRLMESSMLRSKVRVDLFREPPRSPETLCPAGTLRLR